MPFKPCALKLIDFSPSIFKKTRKEREREKERERCNLQPYSRQEEAKKT
jgi:hypothetical protein